ncbi:DUF1772 domain-containing protein [Glycomyces albus]
MDLIRWIALFASTAALGLMAGVFFAYSMSVMPGLARADDRTFVAAFQAIDRAIINPVFLLTFLAALVFPAAATVLLIGQWAAFGWTLAAFALYLAVIMITGRVHLPRNNAIKIKAAEDPEQTDAAAVRERFDEAVWIRWNAVRVVLNLAALGCMAAALVAFA